MLFFDKLVQASNVNMIYFAFYTLTTSLNVVWGGSGYNNGSLIDGSWVLETFFFRILKN